MLMLELFGDAISGFCCCLVGGGTSSAFWNWSVFVLGVKIIVIQQFSGKYFNRWWIFCLSLSVMWLSPLPLRRLVMYTKTKPINGLLTKIYNIKYQKPTHYFIEIILACWLDNPQSLHRLINFPMKVWTVEIVKCLQSENGTQMASRQK